MTKPIEQEFYEAFDIEKVQIGCRRMAMNLPECNAKNGCKHCEYSDYEYPEITDRILLELICVLTSLTYIQDTFDTIESLKDYVLQELIWRKCLTYNAVRKIMGVGCKKGNQNE